MLDGTAFLHCNKSGALLHVVQAAEGIIITVLARRRAECSATYFTDGENLVCFEESGNLRILRGATSRPTT